MSQISELDESIWDRPDDLTATVWPDLDTNGERQARVAYLSSDHQRTSRGYAACYRCDANAAMFIQLRVSSLTPVCAEHAVDLVYAKDPNGTLIESGPYGG